MLLVLIDTDVYGEDDAGEADDRGGDMADMLRMMRMLMLKLMLKLHDAEADAADGAENA